MRNMPISMHVKYNGYIKQCFFKDTCIWKSIICDFYQCNMQHERDVKFIEISCTQLQNWKVIPQLFSVDRPRPRPFLRAPLPRRMKTLDSGLDFLPFLHTQICTDLMLSAVQRSWCCKICGDCGEMWSVPDATEDAATFPLLSEGMPHWCLKNIKLVYFNSGI